MTTRQRDFVMLLSLGLVWALGVAFVGPSGEFSLNDDWAYARSVDIFLQTGEIERVAWTWASIVSHVWSGALASSLFGFSFETLRWTGLVYGFGAGVAAYLLGRACQLCPERAGAVAFVVAFCPVHFNLSFTFMTDPPFAFWVTASFLALAGAARSSGALRIGCLALGALAILAACLLRQPAVAILAAGLAAVAVARVRSFAHLGILAGAGLLVGIAALASGGLLFDADDGGGPMIEYFFLRVLANPNLPYFVLVNGLAVLVYLGWFMAPLAPLVAPPRFARKLAIASGAMAVIVPVVAARLLGDGPPGHNILWDFGLGARTLAGLEQLPSAPRAFWWGMNAIGAALGTWLLGSTALSLAIRFDAYRNRSAILILLLFPAIYVAILGMRVPFFDRYLTAVLPALAVLSLVVAGRQREEVGPAENRAVALACALLVLLSVLGTRDYMERHRSRAVLLAPLVAGGISPQRIDGGFEFSGQHNFDPDESKFLPNLRRWVYDDEFLVTYASSQKGYRPLNSIEYRRLLPPGREQIHVLVRNPVDEGLSRHSPHTPDHR